MIWVLFLEILKKIYQEEEGGKLPGNCF